MAVILGFTHPTPPASSPLASWARANRQRWVSGGRGCSARMPLEQRARKGRGDAGEAWLEENDNEDEVETSNNIHQVMLFRSSCPE
eukprot:742904-Hanusia_phi.AAC.1